MATIAALELKVDKVNDTLIELGKKIDHHLATHEADDKLLQELDETVGGNGKPGLVLRVDRLESAINLMKWFTGIIAGSVVVDIITRILTPIFK